MLLGTGICLALMTGHQWRVGLNVILYLLHIVENPSSKREAQLHVELQSSA